LDEEIEDLVDEDDEADLLQDLNRFGLKDHNGQDYESDGSSDKVCVSDSPIFMLNKGNFISS